MATGAGTQVQVVDVHQLAAVVRNRIDNVLILDSRSFLEFNTCHVIGAVNVCCSKIVKRRLQQDKVTVKELLAHSCQRDVDDQSDIVVYDQASQNSQVCTTDSFLAVLIQKLLPTFRSVNLVSGGFLDFQAAYPHLCEDKTRKCAPLTSLSHPCLASSNQGPTRILPFLYLGSQHDALNKELINHHNIIYELNVSTSCPKPDHIQDAHFLRIPVNDNYSEKLLPHFPKAFQFLDKVRESSGGNVLVHCLAGISRSATIAIAYIMQHMRMTSDDAYRYVKSKRVTISPNFNFLGQLLEYEKQLRREKVLDVAPEPKSAPILGNGQKRLCRQDMRSCHLTLNLPPPHLVKNNGSPSGTAGDQSPTTALAKLSFGNEEPQAKREPGHVWTFPRSLSCSQDWLSCQEDTQVENRARDAEQVVPSKTACGTGRKPLYRLPSEGAVVPHPLDLLPTMDEIECEGSNDAREQASPSDINWKGIPISSLKELNFTPCQTSSSSSSSSSSNSSSAAPSHESTPDPYIHQDKSYPIHTYSIQKHTTTTFMEESTCVKSSYSSTVEKGQEALKWSCDLQSPVSETHMDFKMPEYQRSDSVCTSGLGSEEGSDLQPTSSVEDEDDCESHSAFQHRKIHPLFHLSLPIEKCTSEDHSSHMCDVNVTEVVRSPLSPSESHLLEDLPDEGAEACPENILECSQDSGILTSPGWSHAEIASETLFTIAKDELLPSRSSKNLPSSTSLPYNVELGRKRKSQQWEDSPAKDPTAACQPLLLSTGGRGRSQPWEDSPVTVGVNPTTTPLLLSTSSSRAKPQQWVDPTVTTEHPDPLLLSTNSRDGLYRAQSCPGILSWFALTLEGSAASCSSGTTPSFLRRQRGNEEDRNVKCRNRNSCGSLDYIEYKAPLHQYSSCESCPEVIGECTEGLAAADGGTRERRGTLSPSHRVFQHSRDMIQVS